MICTIVVVDQVLVQGKVIQGEVVQVQVQKQICYRIVAPLNIVLDQVVQSKVAQDYTHCKIVVLEEVVEGMAVQDQVLQIQTFVLIVQVAMSMAVHPKVVEDTQDKVKSNIQQDKKNFALKVVVA